MPRDRSKGLKQGRGGAGVRGAYPLVSDICTLTTVFWTLLRACPTRDIRGSRVVSTRAVSRGGQGNSDQPSRVRDATPCVGVRVPPLHAWSLETSLRVRSIEPLSVRRVAVQQAHAVDVTSFPSRALIYSLGCTGLCQSVDIPVSPGCDYNSFRCYSSAIPMTWLFTTSEVEMAVP